MSNSVFFPLAALCAVLMIAFAAVYPQGIGARSPGPFGHETAARQAARAKKPAKSATAPGEQIVLHEPL